MDMTMSSIRPNRVEVVTSVQRHRRWTSEQKLEIVKQTNEPGSSVSLVARQHGHSLLVVAPFQHGRFRLAPAYDLLPTHSGLGYEEFICGKQGREYTLDNAMSEFDAFGLTPACGN